DELAQLAARVTPGVGVAVRQLAVVDEAQRSVECRPRRQLGRRVVLLVRELPDARVLVVADRDEMVDRGREPRSRRVVERVPVAHVQLGRLEQVAIRSELPLARGLVAAAHWPGATVAGKLDDLLAGRR